MASPKAPIHLRGRLLVRALPAVALLGCQESTPPETAGGAATEVTLRYLCGRNFEVGNGNPTSITVRFEVAGSGEAGELRRAFHRADHARGLIAF
jgi:hypothetical protein